MKEHKVLLVDDVVIYLDILEELLGDVYDIRTAMNGEDAIKLCRESQPDLVLLDLLMPGMDGYEVCRELKGNPETCAIPVIIVTTESDPEAEKKGLDLGAVDYITKPFSPEVVKARVRTHLLIADQRCRLKESISLLEHEKELLGQKAELGIQAGGFAHDMANVLTSLTVLQHLPQELPDEDEWNLLIRDLAGAAKSLEVGMDICHGFTAFLRGMGESPKNHDLEELLQALRIYRRQFRGTLVEDIEEGLSPICCKGWQVKRVLVNLFTNAMQAIEDAQEQEITLRAWQDQRAVHISIRDNGPGIDQAILPRIFDESFTTKKSGTGLGLYITKAIMDAQQGSIAVDAGENGGAEFVLSFPTKKQHV